LVRPDLYRSCEICHGDDQSESISMEVSDIANRHEMRIPQYDLESEVLDQAELVKSLEIELERQPAHRWGDRKKLKKHRRRMEQLDLEIKERQLLLHQRANHHWETFLSLIEILQHFGCLEELSPTEMGRTVGSLRGDNELWLGLSLMSGHLDDLVPSELAAVFEAISTEVKRPDLWSGYPSPRRAEEALNDLNGLRREILRHQDQRSIVIPVWHESELMGLVDAWAKGTSWPDLIANTSLDEGDVVRIMRRTVDLLSQVPYCELVTKQLQRNARLALKAINRFPVCESFDLVNEAEAEERSLNPATERVN